MLSPKLNSASKAMETREFTAVQIVTSFSLVAKTRFHSALTEDVSNSRKGFLL